MRSTDQPVLAVIMVSYRTGPVLFDSLNSVLADPAVDELILVNHDNPADDTARLTALAETNTKLTVIHTGANLGFAKGCNLAAAASSARYLLFLNPDALLSDGTSECLIQTAREQTCEPFVIGARILSKDGREQRGGRRGELTFISSIAGFLGLSKMLGMRDIHREHEPVPEEAVAMPAVSGAAMLMSRQGFDQLGGFDEGYFLHVEDLDICKRARDLGGEVIFEPRAEVLHHGSTSAVSLYKVERWKASGLIRYFRRHGGQMGWLKALILSVPIYGALLGRAMLSRLRG